MKMVAPTCRGLIRASHADQCEFLRQHLATGEVVGRRDHLGAWSGRRWRRRSLSRMDRAGGSGAAARPPMRLEKSGSADFRTWRYSAAWRVGGPLHGAGSGSMGSLPSMCPPKPKRMAESILWHRWRSWAEFCASSDSCRMISGGNRHLPQANFVTKRRSWRRRSPSWPAA